MKKYVVDPIRDASWGKVVLGVLGANLIFMAVDPMLAAKMWQADQDQLVAFTGLALAGIFYKLGRAYLGASLTSSVVNYLKLTRRSSLKKHLYDFQNPTTKGEHQGQEDQDQDQDTFPSKVSKGSKFTDTTDTDNL